MNTAKRKPSQPADFSSSKRNKRHLLDLVRDATTLEFHVYSAKHRTRAQEPRSDYGVSTREKKLQIRLIGSLISTHSLIILIPYKTDIGYLPIHWRLRLTQVSISLFTPKWAPFPVPLVGSNKSLSLSLSPICRHMAARKPSALPLAHV